MPSYSITTTSRTYYNEGDSIIFNISTTGIANGTILYWKNLGNADAKDFSNNINSGGLVINNSTSTLILNCLKDYKKDKNQYESIIIQLRTGSISGSVVATADTKYIKDTSQSGELSLVDLPTSPLIQVPLGNYPLNVTTITNSLEIPFWKFTGNLGSLEVNEISEFYIKSNTTQTFSLYYEKILGNLPNGLNLERDGTISGVVIDNINSTTDYSFVAAFSKNVGSPISTATFTLTVVKSTTTNYTPIWFEPIFSLEQKDLIKSFLNDKTIFTDNLLYRPYDPNFGVCKKLKWYLFYGFENVNYYPSFNLYDRRFLLSEPKIAVAEDENGNLIYEVIYSDILDYNTNQDKESLDYQFTFNPSSVYPNFHGYFPFSIDNAKRRLISDTYQSIWYNDPAEIYQELGVDLTELDRFYPIERKNTENFNPKFMRTRQPESTNVLGYIPCVVYCYTLPNKAKTILDKIKKTGIKFNQLDFTVDRYFRRNYQDFSSVESIKFNYKPRMS